jgi:hypothetical protein
MGQLPVWLPYLIALFFAAWQLRDFGHMQVVDTDAARHGMNGAFIYDLVRMGRVAHPVNFGKEYYAHFPAVSLPFHPPVFPAIEAVFFAITGVNVVSSRLIVALAVGICALLLNRLLRRTLWNDLLAACVTVTILSLWTSQGVATDIMLEFPALTFTLAALLFLPGIASAHPIRSMLFFAGFAIVGVWTKQHAAFLVGVPFLFLILSRRTRLLLRWPFWIGSIFVGAGVAGVMLIWWAFRGMGTPDANGLGTSPSSVQWIFFRNLDLYGDWITLHLLWLPAIFALTAVLVSLWAALRGYRQMPDLALYLAWIVSVAGMLMLLGASSGRYLFWLLPPVITVIYASLFSGSASLWGERCACCLAAGFALLWFANGLRFHPDFLQGPAEAAALVVRQGAPTRIVYAGQADGNFAFAARSLDTSLRTIVISGEKLPHEKYDPAAFEAFCREYGVNWIVIEDVRQARKWSALPAVPPATMQLVASIPLQSSRPRWNGQLRVYRFTEPSSHPRNILNVPIRKLQHSLEVQF